MDTTLTSTQPSTPSPLQNTSPLSEAERRLLLTAATRRMATKPESTRRLEPRYMVPPGCAVNVRSVGGFLKGKNLVVTVRDISRSGLAMLHDGPLAVGSDLEVQVVSADKKTNATVNGKVVRSHQVKGGVHDVGVQLQMPLPMQSLLSVFEQVAEQQEDQCKYAALLYLIENIATVTRGGADLWSISKLIHELDDSVQAQMRAQAMKAQAA